MPAPHDPPGQKDHRHHDGRHGEADRAVEGDPAGERREADEPGAGEGQARDPEAPQGQHEEEREHDRRDADEVGQAVAVVAVVAFVDRKLPLEQGRHGRLLREGA
jgi:hypothetical protein